MENTILQFIITLYFQLLTQYNNSCRQVNDPLCPTYVQCRKILAIVPAKEAIELLAEFVVTLCGGVHCSTRTAHRLHFAGIAAHPIEQVSKVSKSVNLWHFTSWYQKLGLSFDYIYTLKYITSHLHAIHVNDHQLHEIWRKAIRYCRQPSRDTIKDIDYGVSESPTESKWFLVVPVETLRT